MAAPFFRIDNTLSNVTLTNGTGSVGIGTTAPTTTLEVIGDIKCQNLNVVGTLSGSGAGLTNINAGVITNGYIPDSAFANVYTGPTIIGSSYQVPRITVDSKGRVTSAANVDLGQVDYFNLSSIVQPLTNTTAAQNVFIGGIPTSITLQANTVYEIEAVYLFQMGSADARTLAVRFAGTAPAYANVIVNGVAYTTTGTTPNQNYITATSWNTTGSPMPATSSTNKGLHLKGHIKVGAANITMTPQVALSATSAVVCYTQPGTFFRVRPIYTTTGTSYGFV